MIGNMNEENAAVERYLMKKSLPVNYYFIVAKRSEFVNMCAMRGIHYGHGRAHHINHEQQLLGRTIQPQDVITYGDKEQFTPEVLAQIEAQLQMRSKK